MIRKDRSAVAYVAVRHGYGAYAPGEAFPAINLSVEEASRHLKAGLLAEVKPGQDPADVLASVQDAQQDHADDEPAAADEVAFEPEQSAAAATDWPADAPNPAD